jgi:hypothetical protein
MKIRGVVVGGVGAVALAVCVGSVSAKPNESPMKPSATPKSFISGQGPGVAAIDPAVAKRIKPQAMKQELVNDLLQKSAPETIVPLFNVKRLEAKQRAALLGAADPAAVPGPRRFDARTNYHDDSTYMEVLAYSGGSVGIRPLRNYIHFMGSDEVMASPYLRPGALIHFKALANTRYLLECAVDASGQTNFYAADGRGQYSVNSIDKATLLYLRDQVGTTEDVVVQVNADRPGWYLDGCELTALAR